MARIRKQQNKKHRFRLVLSRCALLRKLFTPGGVQDSYDGGGMFVHLVVVVVHHKWRAISTEQIELKFSLKIALVPTGVLQISYVDRFIPCLLCSTSPPHAII